MHENQVIRYMMSKKYKENEYVCWDFVIDVIKDMFGVELPEYPVTEVQAEFKHKLCANFEHIVIPDGEQKEGDIIAFSLLPSLLLMIPI